MQVKKHYDQHLAHFYPWMTGDFENKMHEFLNFLKQNNISPSQTKVAIDLGAGHGIQSIALANMGFDVTAIDFSEKLLHDLKQNDPKNTVTTIQTDITKIKKYNHLNPELVVCCGDTLTHLKNKKVIESLIEDCKSVLVKNGKIILSFRDYATPLNDEQRFIPVKSDDQRILTCILEYGDEKVNVTDLLHEKTEHGWSQKVSSYAKVRISVEEVEAFLLKNGMQIIYNKVNGGLNTIIAEK